jgi:glutaredoxin
MKQIYTLLLLSFLSLAAMAQVPRVPMIEIFSSSTCPPCKPASDVYNPLLDEFHGQVAVTKYPMSWPGAGDPYFTEEGGERRTFYEVTGVPNIFVNGQEVSYTAMDSAYFESLLNDEVYMILELKYFVDTENKRVYYAAHVETEDIFADGQYQMFLSINEEVTYDNATTNGETEFHHIMKKMLPSDGSVFGVELGDSIVSGFELDTSDYFTFAGNYRLPSGANDPVDLATEHSVEEFSDLEMMMWVNNMTTKDVIQAAIGVEVESLDELGFEDDPIDPTDPNTWPIGVEEVVELTADIFPNPAKDRLTVKMSTSTDFTVIKTDLLGKEIYRAVTVGQSATVVNVADMPEGVYMIQIKTDDRSFFDRVVIK